MDNREAIRILSMFTTDEAQRLTSSEFDDAIYMAIKALNNVSEWIPASEPPKEDEQVLVYLAWDSYDIGWVDKNGKWCTEYFVCDPDYGVDAWMPLSKPHISE